MILRHRIIVVPAATRRGARPFRGGIALAAAPLPRKRRTTNSRSHHETGGRLPRMVVRRTDRRHPRKTPVFDGIQGSRRARPLHPVFAAFAYSLFAETIHGFWRVKLRNPAANALGSGANARRAAQGGRLRPTVDALQ
jgi:hypothetical protein